MTPKEQAEELLKEWDFRGTPFNDAGIFVNEMIYENKKYNSDDENEIGYWELVKEELEKMSKNQKNDKEREILNRKYCCEESEGKPINQKINNESDILYFENEEDIEKKRIDIERELSLIEEEIEKINVENCRCHQPHLYGTDYIGCFLGYDKTNNRYGDVRIEKCIYCNCLWLTYFVEYEGFSHSARWFRGIIHLNEISNITPENSIEYLESLDWHFFGGSYFNSTGEKGNGKIRVDFL